MLLYLHGFRSSPQSFKARLLGKRMAALGRAHEYQCPQLPPSPAAAMALARELARQRAPRFVPNSAPDQLTVIGSSLGGYYATWFVERVGGRAVLINPAITPHLGLETYLGTQKNLHTGEPYELTRAHLEG